MNSLSSSARPVILKQLKESTFDLLVIGGGITGAGIALDAASRGLKVALIEKRDFASGTSSKSTKLIHGGLRYLKQLEIQLVREVGRERATVHRLAPHLVKAEKMLLPLVKGGTYGEFATSVGLWVYDVLAGVDGEDKRQMLNKAATLEKEPLLREDILTGSGFYAEYRTDDARLTIENIKTAVKYGTTAINYVKAEGFNYEDSKIKNTICRDSLTDSTFEINAHFVVSAAGPWVDTLRKTDQSLEGKHLFLSKGVHIVVPRKRLPIQQAIYFDVPDGRMLFAIPRQRITYIGTTDTPYSGDKDHIPIYQEDVNYLLEGANSMFPGLDLTTADIESSWAGLRPLIHEEGKSASEMSRKDEIFESPSGLISIAGGKLTGYRKMAERVVDRVTQRYYERFGKRMKACSSSKIPLVGGPFDSAQEVEDYIKICSKMVTALNLDEDWASYLVHNYGKQSDKILRNLKESKMEGEAGLIEAELQFCFENELIMLPMDFLNRRTGRLYFGLPTIPPVLDLVLSSFKSYFGWSEERKKEEKEKLEKVFFQHSHFEPEPSQQTIS